MHTTKLWKKILPKNAKANPKAFWKYTQRKLKTKQGIPGLQKPDTEDNQEYTKTDEEKADVFLSYFRQCFHYRTRLWGIFSIQIRASVPDAMTPRPSNQ